MLNRRRNLWSFLLSCVTAVLVLSSVLVAQSTTTLQGTVSDPSGAVVPNATITVTNQETGLVRTTQSDGNGYYQVAALPPGTYTVEAKSSGLQTYQIKGLVLEVGSTVPQNFQMKVASAGEALTVTAEAPVVESSTMSVGQVISQKTVQEIPLNGRHFVDLGLLIPGSVTPPQNGFLTAPLRGQGSFAFNTAGSREDSVNFMVNGVNLNDMVQNQITFQPSINTVSEFKVDNSTYSAEYGRNSGAIVNIATRSGTNNWHGEAFEFIRNDALDARNFFNKENTAAKSPFKRNQFGGALGGPIVHDRTFFFFSYEGLRQRQGLTLNQAVLTSAQRATATTTANPTVVKLLPLIPVANDPTGARFIGSATAPVNIDQFTGDVSHIFGANDRLHGYYAWQRDRRGEPLLQGNNIPGFGDNRASHRQIFTLGESHVFSSSVVNEARLGFNRIHIVFSPNALLNPNDFGINDGVTAPIGIPQMTIGGIGLNFGGPAGFPQGRGDTTVVLSDTLSWLMGKHSLKFGGEYRRFYNNNFNSDAGSLTFGNVTDFINGQPNGFNITLGNRPSRIVAGSLGGFVMDSYKVTPNFTLELGLRYEWNMTPTEALSRFVVFDPTADALVQVNSSGGPGLAYNQNNRNFQPRIGFAWSVLGGKTVLRAGYGYTTDQPITNSITGLTSNPPLAFPENFTSSVAKPKSTFSTLQTDAAASGLAPATIDRDFRNSYVQSYNVNVQQQLTGTLGLMVGYFGSKGTHLRLARNINQFVSGVRPFKTLSASSPIRPGATLGNITQQSSEGNSDYNALWVTLNKRVSHGLQFNGSYTFSKSIDYNSQNGQGVVVQDSFNIRGDRGLSDFDARHRFVLSGFYELPFKANRIVGGWQLGTIIQLQTGNPINILAGNPPNLAAPAANNGNTSLTGVASIRPDQVGPVTFVRDLITTGGNAGNVLWFTPSVCDPRLAPCAAGTTFALPVALSGNNNVYHFGNVGRNSISGPDFKNVDFSIIKNTKLTERVSTQFRMEAFDLLNHPNLGQPGRVAQVGSSTFGVITSTRFATGDSGSSRQLQFALKFLF